MTIGDAHRDGALWPVLVGAVLSLGVLALAAHADFAHAVQAQAEKLEPEFVRVNKAVEVLSYDARGMRAGSWTDTIAMMRHRATGACWIGSYVDGGHIVWTPAPREVCR